MQTQPYSNAFPPVDEARWRELASAALKGKPLEALDSRTYDGLVIHPLYRSGRPAAAQPGRAPAGESANGWSVVARLDQPDAAAANAQALIDLEEGASGLQIVIAGAVGAYGFGLQPADLERALENVRLDYGIAVEIDAPDARAALALAALVKARGLAPASTAVSFGLDPVGAALRGEEHDNFVYVVKALREAGFAGPFAVADARPVHAAGGAEAQELAFALAGALHVVRALEGAGLSAGEAFGAVAFRLALDADEFLGVAKLRALRRLWARVQELSGVAPAPAQIHGESAWRMMTRRDPYVNMLRTTVSAFAGAVGGADRVSLLPFTQALGLPDSFARRCARNTQLVLLEESNLDKVADPTAGAGGFETLTEQLALKAWEIFQRSEAAGGVLAFAPTLDDEVAAVERARAKAVARRKDPVTGASEFPDIHEKPAAVLAPIPVLTHKGPFAPHRTAEAFEALRDRSDALAEKGGRPRVFLANLGPVAAFNARATFAKNFFEAGGVEAVTNDGFKTADEAAAAFAASGAKIACLCSSDALYPELAAPTAAALAAKGAAQILLAGKPGELEDALKAAGVTGFVAAGGDALATLEQAWKAF